MTRKSRIARLAKLGAVVTVTKKLPLCPWATAAITVLSRIGTCTMPVGDGAKLVEGGQRDVGAVEHPGVPPEGLSRSTSIWSSRASASAAVSGSPGASSSCSSIGGQLGVVVGGQAARGHLQAEQRGFRIGRQARTRDHRGGERQLAAAVQPQGHLVDRFGGRHEIGQAVAVEIGHRHRAGAVEGDGQLVFGPAGADPVVVAEKGDPAAVLPGRADHVEIAVAVEIRHLGALRLVEEAQALGRGPGQAVAAVGDEEDLVVDLGAHQGVEVAVAVEIAGADLEEAVDRGRRCRGKSSV